MANIFKDTLDIDLVYWPISGLEAGQNSEILDFHFVIPEGKVSLRSSHVDDCVVWAKKVGDASYVNISEGSYNLTALPKVDTAFQCYVQASLTLVGFVREIISIGTGSSSDAGWNV